MEKRFFILTVTGAGFLQLLLLMLLITNSGFCQTFTKGKLFKYRTTYFQKEKNVSSEEIISLEITGKRWRNTERQYEAVWNYQPDTLKHNRFSNQFSIGWYDTDTTGYIENPRVIWLHPPRNNQYTLTEIAPFPEVRTQIKQGDSYDSYLEIGYGFGPWSDKRVEWKYILNAIDATATDTIWTVNGTATLEHKVSKSEFIFSRKQGFLSFTYQFYNGDEMTMKLIQ